MEAWDLRFSHKMKSEVESSGLGNDTMKVTGLLRLSLVQALCTAVLSFCLVVRDGC